MKGETLFPPPRKPFLGKFEEKKRKKRGKTEGEAVNFFTKH